MVTTKPFFFHFLQKILGGNMEKINKKKEKRPGWVPPISCVPRNPFLPEAHCRMLYGALTPLTKTASHHVIVIYIYTVAEMHTDHWCGG